MAGAGDLRLALALQNLMWGASQPITGALADKFGALRIMIIGVALYVAGLVVMDWPPAAPPLPRAPGC
jgi:MFS family permease